jgi:hypothetical protein
MSFFDAKVLKQQVSIAAQSFGIMLTWKILTMYQARLRHYRKPFDGPGMTSIMIKAESTVYEVTP